MQEFEFFEVDLPSKKCRGLSFEISEQRIDISRIAHHLKTSKVPWQYEADDESEMKAKCQKRLKKLLKPVSVQTIDKRVPFLEVGSLPKRPPPLRIPEHKV